MTSNECAVKHLFAFATYIVEQDSEHFMGSLDVDSPFTNIPLEETLTLALIHFLKNCKRVEGLSKIEFKGIFISCYKRIRFYF